MEPKKPLHTFNVMLELITLILRLEMYGKEIENIDINFDRVLVPRIDLV